MRGSRGPGPQLFGLRARIEAFIRFAVPYNRQCREKRTGSANDLIMFFRHNLITASARMLASASVDNPLAEIGKGRLSYERLSLIRCTELQTGSL